MEKRKLNDFVIFVPGINPTRAKKQYGSSEINYYDQASFDNDFNHDGEFFDTEKISVINTGLMLKEGDIIISNSLQLAAVVGKANIGKVLTLNFTKVDFKDNSLDKLYFIYLFNAYKNLRRQKERELQGNSSVLRIPIKSLTQLEIPVLPLNEQKKIGKIYIETLKLQSKLSRYSNLIEDFTNLILEENLKG